MEYDVEIVETLRMTVKVEADSRALALEQVEQDWKDEQYILDASHFTGVTFRLPYTPRAKPHRQNQTKRNGPAR